MRLLILAAAALYVGSSAIAQTVTVTPANFARAETDKYFASVVTRGGFGKLAHRRDLASPEQQGVVRPNRDTLYSSGIFDLDAGPVTVRLPESGDRFMSLMVLNEDHYVQKVAYGGGNYTVDRASAGTRYVMISLRIFVDPSRRGDIDAARLLQDRSIAEQPLGPGIFSVPAWDSFSRERVKDALIVLGTTQPNLDRAFGKATEVDPVEHLIGSAIAWGGNPRRDAAYLNVTPDRNDGSVPYRLSVSEVPVDAFWSITVYDRTGQLFFNADNIYSINSKTATYNIDRSVTVRFGGCAKRQKNCLPITKNWNYMVRLYRPQSAILEGLWTFPEASSISR